MHSSQTMALVDHGRMTRNLNVGMGLMPFALLGWRQPGEPKRDMFRRTVSLHTFLYTPSSSVFFTPLFTLQRTTRRAPCPRHRQVASRCVALRSGRRLCICIYIYIYIYICQYIYIYTHMCTCLYVYMYRCVSSCYMCTCVYIYTCVCIYIYICTYKYIYIYIYM